MPTSLTYFIPLARGFSPWRPDAVMSTDRQEVTCHTHTHILFYAPHSFIHHQFFLFFFKKKKNNGMECGRYIYIYMVYERESVLPGRTFSRDGGSAPDAPEAGALCRSSDPLSGRSDSRVIVLCFRATPTKPTTRRETRGRRRVLDGCLTKPIRSDEGRGQAACCSLTGDR